MNSVSSTSWVNWAGNQRAEPVRIVEARDAGEVAAAVKAAARDGLRVRALGSGHSFTGIGVPEGVGIRPPAGPGITLDGELATVPAGMTIRTLNAALWAAGRALPNLGDIDAQTISGAISTGTHGTGAGFRGIAAQVRGLELVLADGSVVDADGELLRFGAVGLGALGVITAVTLETVPAFRLHAVERVVPLAEALELAALPAEHAEFYWFPHTATAMLKRNNRVPAESGTGTGAGSGAPSGRAAGPRGRAAGSRGRAAEWFGDELVGNGGFALCCALGDRVPALVPRLNRVMAGQMAAPEYTDRSYRVFCSPRRVRFLEMEYAVPREALAEAFAGLRAAASAHAAGVTFPVEVRIGAADDLPLSTSSGRDTAYLAVHVHRGQPHARYFGAVEEIMVALGGRPHWGKVHTRTAADLRESYPEFAAFVALRDRLDPEGRFRNAYLDRVLGVTTV